MILSLEPRRSVNSAWLRLPAWAAIIAFSVVQAHGPGLRIATGVLLVVGAVLLYIVDRLPASLAGPLVVVMTVLGLAACYTSHQGLAEVLVVLAAAKAPESMDGRLLQAFTVLDAVAFGVTVAVIAASVAGALAGLGIPAMVQRAREHQAVIRERDRAQALLAEVQAGREAESQAAALRERGRIAREMHDVLAHTLAGLSMQLQGVRAVAAREGVPDSVLGPIDTAAVLARDGLAEARSAVGALRDPVGLGIDELPALVARHPGNAGLDASGEPGPVSAEAGHAVYRAVQESLTNAARYAPGSPVRVSLDWEPERLVVRVSDEGASAGRDAVTGRGSGLGLAGMAERITAVGGTVHSGPAGAGGWENRIEVPIR